MPRPWTKWQLEFHDQVKAMNNNELFEAMLDATCDAASDHSGKRDFYRADYLAAEMTRRLTDAGFLQPQNTPQ